MKVVKTNDLIGSNRDIRCPNGGFRSLRILLEKDKMGYSLTETHIPKGEPQFWHYKNHFESCFCVKGYGKLVNLDSGEEYSVYPGVVYILDRHDRHTFQAIDDVILICVFNPPLKGQEVHRKDGSYE